MKWRKFWNHNRLISKAVIAFALAAAPGVFAQSAKNDATHDRAKGNANANDAVNGKAKGNVYGKMRSTTQAQRKAAAANSKKKGLRLGTAGTLAAMAKTATAPVGTAATFSATANTKTRIGMAPAFLGTPNAATAPLPGMTPDYFGPYSNYANSPLPGGPILSIALTNGGSGYTNPIVTITDLYGIGTGALSAVATQTGGVITAIAGGTNGSGYVYPLVDIADDPLACGGASQPVCGTGATATAAVDTTQLTGGMRKFINALATPPVATPDTSTYSGSDYYEIELGEYSQQMHTDLAATTKLRGYRQTNMGGTAFSYLGPIIVAQRDKPVRIKFTNSLPTGAGGNLFIPVDTTYMGAGTGSNNTAEQYTQNRAAVHLHGATTPWISDGTVYQWITPHGETTSYPKGVSVQNVPDMGTSCDAADSGCMTFFYTNQQSARLMFYHDHAAGITRLNVYAGVAAGYIVSDSNATRDPITPTYGEGTPLVIQDKTFVWGTPPTSTTLGTGTWATDPTWDNTKWGTAGNLWFPHVYMTNQNPYDESGANAMGRWDYGPWFWPPFTGLLNGPVANPYYDPINAPWEPPQIPGVPDLSATPESFMDTPVINGVAYPTLNVDPKAYRFRILSVGNDRMLNLSLWVAADKTTPTTAGSVGTALCTSTAIPVANCTEVKMVPWNSSQNAISHFPSWWYDASVPNKFDDRDGGVPDPATRGPAMIQIATEGGFLPAPVVIRNQPVNYVMNKRDITVGNVAQKALFLGPAERADVLVDFTNFAGQTLILYNDSPAPVPAADPRLDYFTGDEDQTSTGGAPTTIPGYGPNTRTIMQIVVSATTPPVSYACVNAGCVDDYNPSTLTALQTAIPAAFKASQDVIIVPQAAYNQVYGTNIVDSSISPTRKDLVNIADNSMVFTPLTQAGALQSTPVLFDLQPKSIIEDFQVDYGRMNAILGVEIPRTNNTNQTSIPQALADPPTEVIKITDPSLTPIGQSPDGTQIWKITHNGVDTHAIHVHMFTAQIVNRVGWDGAIRKPDANELGFKDTIRMNPLEDIIVALRPIKINLPFKVPNSIRPLVPEAALGATTGPTGAPLFTNVDPTGTPTTITNQLANFGWEYVWHCHILGHEENDMMRPMALAVAPETPTSLAAAVAGSGTGKKVNLTWTDNSANETSFTVQRATVVAGPYANLATFASTTPDAFSVPVSYQDAIGNTAQPYYYRVFASNTVGSVVLNYPQVTADSAFSNRVVANVPPAPAAPSNLTATILSATQVRLNWRDNSNNESGFQIFRSVNGGAFVLISTSTNPGANVVTYTDTGVSLGNAYSYKIRAWNAGGFSAYAGPITVTVAVPAAPTNVTLAATAGATTDTVTVTWTASAYTTNYRIQRATDSAFTTSVTSYTVTASPFTQSVGKALTYYYRIRANNGVGSSAYVNTTPASITTP